MNEQEHFRLFVSINIPEQIKNRLAAIQAKLRYSLPERAVTWTKPDQLHLTLKFLGDVEAERLAELKLQLRSACGRLLPMKLVAKGAGAFPDLRFPRVIWIGLEDGEGKLLRTQQAMDEVCRAFMPPEPPQKFSGHVTLGRVKRLGRQDTQTLSKLLTGFDDRVIGEWTSAELDLMRSELSSAGARHSILERLPLCFE